MSRKFCGFFYVVFLGGIVWKGLYFFGYLFLNTFNRANIQALVFIQTITLQINNSDAAGYRVVKRVLKE